MKKTAKILNIIAIILVVLQIFSYLGSEKAEAEVYTDKAWQIGHFIGYNFTLIIALILFIIAYPLRRKVKKQSQIEMIDSIGKKE